MADYDTTLARIAGNIVAGLVNSDGFRRCPMSSGHNRTLVVQEAVMLARDIVAEIKRTEIQKANK